MSGCATGSIQDCDEFAIRSQSTWEQAHKDGVFSLEMAAGKCRGRRAGCPRAACRRSVASAGGLVCRAELPGSLLPPFDCGLP